MKRVYESPVMMLEGFEANEYVAACWDIICNGCTNPPGWLGAKGYHSPGHGGVGVVKTEGSNEPILNDKVFSKEGAGDATFNAGKTYVDAQSVEHWSVVYTKSARANAS